MDIDIDFQDDRREEVVDYCKAKYGEKSVASIITFGTMAARKVIEDMCRVYNISDSFAKPNKFAEYIKAFIPMDPKITLKKALEENPEFQTAYDENENVKFIVDESMKLEGLKRNISTHACGKVICDGDINQYCPTVSVYDKDTSQWQKTAAWNMTEIEEVGLLKMDFLGLKTMTILDECVKTINYFEGSDLTIDNIPLYDVESYEFLAKGNTVGVFQLESPGMTSFIMQLFQDVEKRRKEIEAKHCSDDIKKEELENFGKELFERLIAGISLYRPGPMDSIPEYLAGMVSGVIHYDTPELETILESTYGQLVYQEQVILAVQKLAGFSASQADVVRKAMGKKKQYILDEYKPYFIYGSGDKRDEHTGKLMDIPGCIANGISETVATTIWNKMEAFGRYAFNKSHSAAYAVNSVKTAWCATHYPEIFHKSLMNVFISRPDKVKVYLADAIRMNIKVLPPSVNYSNRNFTMSGGTQIRFGLEGIKKVKKLAEKIIQEHSIRGSFSSFQNFVERMMIHQSLNRGAIESLIYAGAMDDFDGTRKAKISIIEDLMNAIRSGVEFQVKGQRTIFDLDPSLNKMKEFEIPDIEDYEKNTKFFKEEEMTGLFITGHPMEDFEKGLSAYQVLPLSTFADKEEDEADETTENMYIGKNVRVAGIIYNLERKITSRGDRMFTFDLKDRAGEIRCVVFAKTADKYDDSIFQEKQMVVIGGKFEQNDFGSQVIVSNLIEIHNLPDSIRSISCTCFSNAKYAKIDYLTAFNDLAKANPGNATFEAKIDGVHYKLPCIHVSYPLFAKLQQIAGEDAVYAM